MICACRELVPACAACCTGHVVSSATAKAPGNTIIAESDFFFLSGYLDSPHNTPDAVTNPLYSRGFDGRLDNKLKLWCIQAERIGRKRWKSGRF
jgi:hypothetical protein